MHLFQRYPYLDMIAGQSAVQSQPHKHKYNHHSCSGTRDRMALQLHIHPHLQYIHNERWLKIHPVYVYVYNTVLTPLTPKDNNLYPL